MPAKTKITKDEFINAAFEITAERGIEAATTRAIAQKVGCSVRPLIGAFENIENLREAVLEKAMRKYTKYLQAKVEGVTELKAIGLNYIHFAKTYPHLFKLIFFSERQATVSVIDSSLDENKPHVVELIKREYGIENERRAVDIYTDLGIYCNGIAAMLISKSVKFTDEIISGLITAAAISFTKGHGKAELHWAQCPKCKQKLLRAANDLPFEISCQRCGLISTVIIRGGFPEIIKQEKSPE
jgi:AcrR family transcriptional regulator